MRSVLVVLIGTLSLAGVGCTLTAPTMPPAGTGNAVKPSASALAVPKGAPTPVALPSVAVSSPSPQPTPSLPMAFADSTASSDFFAPLTGTVTDEAGKELVGVTITARVATPGPWTPADFPPAGSTDKVQVIQGVPTLVHSYVAPSSADAAHFSNGQDTLVQTTLFGPWVVNGAPLGAILDITFAKPGYVSKRLSVTVKAITYNPAVDSVTVQLTKASGQG